MLYGHRARDQPESSYHLAMLTVGLRAVVAAPEVAGSRSGHLSLV